MADDSKRHRHPRAGSMSDEDRALAYRRTPRSGVPIMFDGDDLTPPPREPTSLEAIDGFGELAAPIADALRSMHNTLREHDLGFARLWDARHVTEQLGELRSTIDGMLAGLKPIASVPALLQAQGTHLGELRGWVNTMQAASAKLDATLTQLDHRLDTVERDSITVNATMNGLTSRLAEMFGAITSRIEKDAAGAAKIAEDHEARLDAIEDHRTDTHEARIKSLEDDRIRVKAWAALIGFLAGVGAFLLSKLSIGR